MSASLAALLVEVVLAQAPESRMPVLPKGPQSAIQKAIDHASCTGEYADAILALAPHAREFERQPEANYSYCLRNTATYECPYYGPDARMRRRTIPVVAHGTAFAYREKNDEFYLLTNEHVASWPAVTDEEHEIAGVPLGCRKVEEQLRLVRDQSDDYEPGQIPVTRVAGDAQLDAAVLKSKVKLNLMPYRIGRSALLKSGNVVQIRGYPLGLLQATNFGKVVSAYDHDREKGWDHIDFVTDALVSRGNSGSPVLAVSCRTGELELVGLYHAGYRDSPALNVVVGIDQIREFMETFRRTRPSRSGDDAPLSAEARGALVAGLGRKDALPFFRLGDRTARVRLDGLNTLVFEIFGDGFPSRDDVAISLRDSPGDGAGALESFGVDRGDGRLRWARPEVVDAESQNHARRLLELARRQFLRTLAFRDASQQAKDSRDASRRAADMLKQLDRARAEGNDLLRSMGEIAARLPEAPAALAGAQDAAGPPPEAGAPAAATPAPPGASRPQAAAEPNDAGGGRSRDR